MRTSKRSILYWSCVATTGVATILAACSKQGEGLGDDFESPGGAPSTGTAGSFSTGSGLSSPSASAGSDNGGIFIPPNGTGGGSGGAIDECAGEVSKANLTPVNMFIQFDRSTSMLDQNKWEQASKALTAFFQDPEGDGLKVALRFFPADNPVAGCKGALMFGGGQQFGGQQFGGQQQGTGGGGPGSPGAAGAGSTGAAVTCLASACEAPLVPLGPLLRDPAPTDAQEAKLVQAVVDSAPDMDGGGGTPLLPALQGALDWAKKNQAATPGEKTVIVLVTDGEPSVCCENASGFACPAAHLDEITAVAAEGNSLGIQTYVIGIAGASERQVNAIAEAGGTREAYFAGNAATAQQDLVEALKAIRGNALECQFEVPRPDGNQVLDPGQVNIQFTNNAGTPESLKKATSCETGGDWVYDNETNPKSISLCDATCTRITNEPNAQLEIKLGCATVPF